MLIFLGNLGRTGPCQAIAVGYGKPPVLGRFQKGRSGNPGGKPGPEKTKRYEFAQMLNAGMSESTELVATTPCTSIWAATAKGILLDGVRGKIPAIRLSFSLLDELDGVPRRKRRGIDGMLAEARAADEKAGSFRNEQETNFPAQGITRLSS